MTRSDMHRDAMLRRFEAAPYGSPPAGPRAWTTRRLILGRHVAGVVSEADLLSVPDKRARHAQLEPGGRLRRLPGAVRVVRGRHRERARGGPGA